MFEYPSLITRIAIGKSIGFVVGLLGFFFVPHFAPELGSLFQWEILLWYTTLGAIVGIFGVFTQHPVLNFPMPWWVRSPVLGAWMNFVLAFFAYDAMQVAMHAVFGADSFLQSPFWFVLEGAIVGLFIGYFATKFGSEGPETVKVAT